MPGFEYAWGWPEPCTRQFWQGNYEITKYTVIYAYMVYIYCFGQP